MDDTLMSEEYEEGEGDSGTSGILTLDGEAWKNRENTTYNSLLDINGVTDLQYYSKNNILKQSFWNEIQKLFDNYIKMEYTIHRTDVYEQNRKKRIF